MAPLISLVVLGFQNFDLTTRTCLDSLKPWLDDTEIEVVVIDNGSNDDSAQKTTHWCSRHPKVKLLLSNINRGYAGGMNWGASHTSGKWLLLVNNDTVFPPSTLEALKEVIHKAPENVAMLGPVTNSAGNGQRLWRPNTTPKEWLNIGKWLNENPTQKLIPTYRCDFFCIAIKSTVWHQLRGLNPDFGLGYYEDFDFSLRLKKAGYKQMITEDVFIFHTGSATFRGNAATSRLIKKNKKLLKSLHRDAHFEHTRLGNLKVLTTYNDLKLLGQWTPELEVRFKLRAGALKGDAPRSFFKRWLWKYHTRLVLNPMPINQ
jgi:GT2 family glycosyltransferase